MPITILSKNATPNRVALALTKTPDAPIDSSDSLEEDQNGNCIGDLTSPLIPLTNEAKENGIENCLGIDIDIPDTMVSEVYSYLIAQNNCSEEAQAEIIALIEMINDMDKECQARILVGSILSVNTAFTNLIKNYFLLSENSNLGLQDLETGTGDNQIPENVGARVYPTLSFDPITLGDVVVMQFSNDYLDTATNLGVVNTFYHELLHAYILDLYYKGQLLSTFPSYSNLNIAITNYLTDTDNATLADIYNQEMHNIYIDFVDLLAESLYEYCLQNNINGVDLSYATKLVWGGLNGYNIFNTNLTQTQRLEAQTLLGYENFNHTEYAKGPKTCN